LAQSGKPLNIPWSEGPPVAGDRVDLKEVDADPLPVTKKTLQLRMDDPRWVSWIWRRRHLRYWESLDPKYLKD